MNQYTVTFCVRSGAVETEAVLDMVERINEYNGHIDAVIPTTKETDDGFHRRTETIYIMIYSASKGIPTDGISSCRVLS